MDSDLVADSAPHTKPQNRPASGKSVTFRFTEEDIDPDAVSNTTKAEAKTPEPDTVPPAGVAISLLETLETQPPEPVTPAKVSPDSEPSSNSSSHADDRGSSEITPQTTADERTLQTTEHTEPPSPPLINSAVQRTPRRDDYDGTDTVIVERGGKIELVAAADVQALDPELVFRDEPTPQPPSRPRTALRTRPNSAKPVRRVQSARTEKPLPVDTSVGHSSSFHGPGKHLHRFKNAASRDAFESWYTRKLRAPTDQHKPHRSQTNEEEKVRKDEAKRTFAAWQQRKDEKIAEERRQARAQEKLRLQQSHKHPAIAQAAYDDWKRQKEAADHQHREEQAVRARLLRETAMLMQQRESASQLAVHEWLQSKHRQAQLQRKQEDERLRAQRRELRTKRRSLRRPERRFEDATGGFDATACTTRSLPSSRPMSHVGFTTM